MPHQTLGQGKYLRLLLDDKWEYVERKKSSGVVVILPLTRDQKILLVEQPRAAVGHKPVIGLPAGLAGDGKKEKLLTAAKRELKEETGATSEHWTHLTTGPSSPGLTSEMITFYAARKIQRTQATNPDPHENITLHEIPLRALSHFLHTREKAGALIDYKIFAALYLAGIPQL